MADDKKYIGKRMFTTAEGFVDDDGYWKVIVNVGESRTEDGEDWETLFIDAMSIDKDFGNGYQTAVTSALKEFVDKTIKRNFNSLFDAEEFDTKVREKLEEEDAAKNKSNKAS